MSTLDVILTIIGLVYGVFLIICTFVSNRLTEALRIDALFMPKPTPATRFLNLAAGLAAIGYYGYTALKSMRLP